MKTEPVTDAEVIEAMRRYGGGFVSALAIASGNADHANLERIKSAWPEYWKEYTAVVMVMRKDG